MALARTVGRVALDRIRELTHAPTVGAALDALPPDTWPAAINLRGSTIIVDDVVPEYHNSILRTVTIYAHSDGEPLDERLSASRARVLYSRSRGRNGDIE